MKRALRVLPLLALSAAILASCSYIPFTASSSRAANAPVLAPANPASVAILRDPPSAQYVTLGEIRLDMRGLRTATWALRDTSVRTAIQEEAAKLGADAVIYVRIQERSLGRRPDQCCGQEPPVLHHIAATAIRTRL